MRKFERIVLPAFAFYLATVGLIVSYLMAPPALPKSGCISIVEVGRSVMGTPITLCHVGGSHIGAKHSLLVIGSVHGTEHAGVEVVDQLVQLGANGNTDLWVVRNGNPDGYALGTRMNANGVNLNRNFPFEFLQSGDGTERYSGPSAASEPETKALMKAIDLVHPKSMITMHQPYGLIDCATGPDPTFSAQLAMLTGLPTSCIPGELSGSPTNSFTGTITMWATDHFKDTTAVAVEFAKEVSPEEIKEYANAIRRF